MQKYPKKSRLRRDWKYKAFGIIINSFTVFWTSLPPEAEIFCIFRAYFVIFTTKNDAFLKGFANKIPKNFRLRRANNKAPLIPNPSLIRGGLFCLGGTFLYGIPLIHNVSSGLVCLISSVSVSRSKANQGIGWFWYKEFQRRSLL